MLGKIIGIFVSAFVVSILLIKASSATCFPSEFKLERGNRENNIQTIIDFGNCLKKENKERVGKYFCYVENMVGIQVDDKNKKTSGNIKPSDEKFFITIEEISDNQKRISCDWGEFGLDSNLDGHYMNNCLANYKIKSSLKNEIFGSSADGMNFVDPISKFSLYGTNEFVWLQSAVIVGSYISRGKCEKIN
jgi:hypothetical protein